jgi:hypothetical protein
MGTRGIYGACGVEGCTDCLPLFDEMNVPILDFDAISSADEARTAAIEWQAAASACLLGYGELAVWQGAFERLAERFGLSDEFRENGII